MVHAPPTPVDCRRAEHPIYSRFEEVPMPARVLFTVAALLLFAACETPPWEMPCEEGWVMDADQECYDPAGDDDSASDDDDDA
jgi:hypothetical protein